MKPNFRVAGQAARLPYSQRDLLSQLASQFRETAIALNVTNLDLYNLVLYEGDVSTPSFRAKRERRRRAKELIRTSPRSIPNISLKEFLLGVEPKTEPTPPPQPQEEPQPVLTTVYSQVEQYMCDRVQHAQENEILVKVGTFELRRQECMRLWSQDGWLNDEIVNAYCHMLKNHVDVTRRKDSCYFFSTHFMTKYNKTGHSGVRRWTKKIDLFSCDIVFFPINVTDSHWRLAVALVPAKQIWVIDSSFDPIAMGQDARGLIEYLQTEATAKDKKEYASSWGAQLMAGPQQQNGNDCGVFVLASARSICKHGKLYINYTPEEMPKIRVRILWELVQGELKDMNV